MSVVKIEHVDPTTSNPIAFDVMAIPRKDKEGKAIKSTKNPDGTLTYEDGTVVTVDNDGNEIRETMVIQPGHFRIINLSGGLMLHEVSQAELDERDRKVKERVDIEAEVARDRKAKDDKTNADKVAKEREDYKKVVEAEVAKRDAEANKPVVAPVKPVLTPPIIPGQPAPVLHPAPQPVV